jgi:TRAP-type C4-dicarboxylate transport system permease small subunit
VWKKPIDLRKYTAQTKNRLVWVGVGLIGFLGILLILLTYGTPAAGCGAAFFLIAAMPVGLILLFLRILQWIVDRSKKNNR